MVPTAAFELCLGPWDIDGFLDGWWERAPLIVARREAGRFDRLITRATFDRFVAHGNLRLPFFRVFKDGALVPLDACTTTRQVGPNLDTGLADLNALYDGFADGATIVLMALEKALTPFGRLCRELEALFGCPFQAYAYLSPPDARGPPAHYDTHDVIALQVTGHKHWRIWDAPWPLPMRMSENAYDHEAVLEHAERDAPIAEVTLAPGDSLYVPRGFIHAAVTGDEPSLHISLSAMVVRWLDVIDDAVRNGLAALKTDPEAQRALAFGRQPGEPAAPEDNRVVAALAERLVAHLAAQCPMKLAHANFDRQRGRDRRGDLTRRLGDAEA
jgi:hypothetical protein